MCGIIAVLRRRSDRPVPDSADVLGRLDGLAAELRAADGALLAEVIGAAAERVEAVDGLLRGTPGVRALLGDRTLRPAVDALVDEVGTVLAEREAGLDDAPADPAGLEAVNAAVVRLKDALWAVQRDRLRTAAAVADLAGPDPSRAAVEALASVQAALSALDRLEVRGRDSAGLTLLVRHHQLELDEPGVAALLASRDGDGLFTSEAVRVTPEGHLSLVYKAAAEIGELGDNTAVLRAAIRDDVLLHRALQADSAEVTVLGTPGGRRSGSSPSPTPTP
ncbi:MAG: hypothetical protein R2746_13965 [Acidimicrobiales bacterium]